MNNEQVYNEIDELIVRYLTGEIDKFSFNRLREWAAESEEHRTYVRKQLEVAFSAGVARDRTKFNKERGYALFRQRVADYKSEMASNRRPFPWKAIGWGVAVALLLLLPLAGFWQGRRMLNQRFASVKMETAMGARTRITLPDGTQVCLNAGSYLEYPQDFGINNRRLNLVGEAYFDVTHNGKLPFIINTKELDLRVLGTRFSFSNYADDDYITVDLAKGKVALSEHRNHQEIFLTPNERMVYNKKTGEMRKTAINADNTTAWTHNELFFDEQPLSEIAKELSRAYNVKIEVAGYLKNKSFYGSFDQSKNTIDDVLRTISATNQMKYRYRGGKYLLY